jgi:hypothetical protein
LSHEFLNTFKIYKKEGSEVSEGASPLAITGLAPGTEVVKGGFVAVAVEGDRISEPVDIPAFTVPAVEG